MHKEQTGGRKTEPAMDFWANQAKAFQSFMTNLNGGTVFAGASKGDDAEGGAQKGSFNPFFQDPGYMEAVFGNGFGFPGMTREMAKGVSEYGEDILQAGVRTFLKSNGWLQETAFGELDRKLIETFGEIYETGIRKFFEVPQLGLNRFRQERLNRFADRFNLFQKSRLEFLRVFFVPVEKAAGEMREKMEEMFRTGDRIEDVKQFHTLWIRTLEEQYHQHLRSPEYTGVLRRVVDSTVQLRMAREELLYDLLEGLPVPTNREMDELYKDLYNLKKIVRKALPETSIN